LRTLSDVCEGADVLIGLSKAGAFNEQILKKLAPEPIIFAMANPVPEITPIEAKKIRPDCIIATGRSDYPNQINNVMCFPFLFRAALDT
jgi:malate dehydrogenase (oxaloacetate-decarboxylating)(NADP+)